MEEVEEGGISFGEIFRTIFSQKWLALIIAVIITLGGTIGLYFYGKSTREYSVKFVLQLPGSGSSPASFTYPNGSNFYFTDLISATNLAAIRESNEDYSDIKVAEMVKSGDISISREITETDTTAGRSDATYTIKAKAKYFNSQDQAREFFTDVAHLPENKIREMDINYDMYITAAKEAVTYAIEFDFLTNQVEYLQAIYDSYIESYGGSFVIDGGKTLLSYRSDLNVFILNGSISNRRTECNTKFYIKSESSREKYATDKEEFERQYKIENQTLNILKGVTDENGQSSSIITTVGEVLTQSKIVEELNLKIQDYDNLYKYGKVNASFNRSVNAIEDEVAALTKDFEKVSKAIFANATSVSFAGVNIVELQSKIGLLMSAAISLIAGLVIAAVVAYIVGYVKKKKAAEAASVPGNSEPQPGGNGDGE